eukprot:GHVH01008835.1.p1 GENE.GHVH01008835.1~~GHVH01008835.1.p1  ORF type:complete len:290 (-),score=42.19 GHVH01008835.1:446-1285(-)
MPKFVQFVVGPAGCGKSTYCHLVQEACAAQGRSCRVINLDPAAEEFLYKCELDIRHLVTVDDVMETLDLGPNGGLVHAIEFVTNNMHECLEEDLDSFADDDYLLFDCPGQIELYTHLNVMKRFVDQCKAYDYQMVAVYCLDVSFVNDAGKFISGCLSCLSTMIQLNLPHVSLLTKCDLLTEQEKEELDRRLDMRPREICADLTDVHGPKYKRLHETMTELLEAYSLVGFIPIDASDEDSVREALLKIDMTIGYGENLDTKEPRDDIVDNDANGEFSFGT